MNRASKNELRALVRMRLLLAATFASCSESHGQARVQWKPSHIPKLPKQGQSLAVAIAGNALDSFRYGVHREAILWLCKVRVFLEDAMCLGKSSCCSEKLTDILGS